MPTEAELLTTAQRHRQAGQAQAAIALCRQALAERPASVAALSLLGAIYTDLGDFNQAREHFDRALALDPNCAPAHDGHGLLHARQGAFAEAASCFQRAIACDAGQVISLFNLASARFQLGDAAGTIEPLQRALQLDPSSLRAHTALAAALAKLGRQAEAVPHLAEIARQKPADADAQRQLAAAALEGGEYVEAEAAYRQALALEPNSLDSYTGLAESLIQQSRYDEAIACCQRALQSRPDDFLAHFKLGQARLRQGQFAEAAQALADAARLEPDSAEAHTNLGIALAQQLQFVPAETALRRAIALRADQPQALHNLGLALMGQDRMAEGLVYVNQSLALAPDNPRGHYARATALLSLGDFLPGWESYEHRVDCPPYNVPRLPKPLWDGSPLAGRTLLVSCEQGLGDTLQFIRFVRLFQPNEQVIVGVQPPLVPLLAQSGIRGLIPLEGDLPAYDVYIPLLSLPRIFRTELATIPRDVPYLHADPAKIDAWHAKLAAWPGFKIGIAWHGRPDDYGRDTRSIPLAMFARLAHLPNVRLISLQKGQGSEQLAALAGTFDVVDLGPVFDTGKGAFLDTAAVMANLDLVITSDTSIAHLAGGLGVRVWVALSALTEWRWLIDRQDSPWYPTLRLFRQSVLGRWDDVFERIASELRPLVGHSSSPDLPC